MGVSIQIPFELASNTYDQLGSLLDRNFAQLIVSEEAGGTAAVEATPEIDTIHILRRGDTVLNPEMAGQQTATIEPQAMVTHADGRPVNRANPADAGEALVMYLTGLGPANPDAPGARTGEPATRATPISGVRLAFDFRPDSTPGRPAFGSDTAPVFAGMTPGFAGLYQVNFVVPEPPPGYKLRCGTLAGGTNLTVNVARSMRSFDGIGICVNLKP